MANKNMICKLSIHDNDSALLVHELPFGLMILFTNQAVQTLEDPFWTCSGCLIETIATWTWIRQSKKSDDAAPKLARTACPSHIPHGACSLNLLWLLPSSSSELSWDAGTSEVSPVDIPAMLWEAGAMTPNCVQSLLEGLQRRVARTARVQFGRPQPCSKATSACCKPSWLSYSSLIHLLD